MCEEEKKYDLQQDKYQYKDTENIRGDKINRQEFYFLGFIEILTYNMSF